MPRMEGSNVRWDLQPHFTRTYGGRSLLEVDAWIPGENQAISPLVERLMRLTEGSHCIASQEYEVELALRDLSKAVVHGNRLDAHKLVHVRCRSRVGKGIRLTVSDEGQGFDEPQFLISRPSRISKRSTDVASSL